MIYRSTAEMNLEDSAYHTLYGLSINCSIAVCIMQSILFCVSDALTISSSYSFPSLSLPFKIHPFL